MAYGATGDIESKVSSVYANAHVGDYSYDNSTGRLTTVAGETQSYDANGNLETGRGRTLHWTSFNKPRSIQQGDTTQYFAYNAERERVLQIVGSKRTVMLDAALSGMAGFSVEVDSITGHKRYQHTVMAGGKPVASVIVNQEKNKTLMTENTNYLHVDRLGSVVMVTDEDGRKLSKTVFDAWGLRRGTEHQNVSDPFAVDLRHSKTDRGFTQHQMLDDVGLIHMNARLYDPVLGRMLSADSIAPEPGYTQGLNRYAYAYNNPFGYTDPSGHKPSGLQSIVASIFNIAITAVLSAVGVPPPIAHAIGSYVEGWIASGGDTRVAKASARAGFVRGAFQWAGQAAGIKTNTWQSITLDAFAGGTASVANGGDFDTGFYTAGINSWVNAGIGEGASVAQVTAQATAGAISAKATGGDPMTGAVTSGFGRLFGDSQRRGSGGSLAGGGDEPPINARVSSAASAEIKIWQGLDVDKARILLTYIKGSEVLDTSVNILTVQIMDQLEVYAREGFLGQYLGAGEYQLSHKNENKFLNKLGSSIYGKLGEFKDFVGYLPFDAPNIQFKYGFIGNDEIQINPVLLSFP